jgi:hypothetical protein
MSSYEPQDLEREHDRGNTGDQQFERKGHGQLQRRSHATEIRGGLEGIAEKHRDEHHPDQSRIAIADGAALSAPSRGADALGDLMRPCTSRAERPAAPLLSDGG